MAKTDTKKLLPTLLAHARSLNPGHMLMFSSAAHGKLSPVVVRAEPLRGLNATAKTPDEKRREAVLQVVESAELAAGDDTLVLRGKLLVRNNLRAPFACNVSEYATAQAALVDAAVADGLVKELAQRYAINIFSGTWGWRNALESDKISVKVSWGSGENKHEVHAEDLLLSQTSPFDINQYPQAKDAIEKLAQALADALTGAGRGTLFHIEGRFFMGEGARVYPSQEWAAESFKAATKREWGEKGEGVTRVLAKIRNAAGEPQAIINDRKTGNAMRVVDTWYGEGDQAPIAAEIYGANAHQGVCLRPNGNSFFDVLGKVVAGEPLTPQETLYYLAVCVRGGVFGSKE